MNTHYKTKCINPDLLRKMNPIHLKILLITSAYGTRWKYLTYNYLGYFIRANKNQVQYGMKKLKNNGLISTKRTRWGFKIIPLIKLDDNNLIYINFDNDNKYNYSHQNISNEYNIRDRILRYSKERTDQAALELKSKGYNHISLEILADYLDGVLK